EQAPRPRPQPADRPDGGCTLDRCVCNRGLAVRGQGVTSTPGRIVSNRAAATSPPMPPGAPSRTIASGPGSLLAEGPGALLGEALGEALGGAETVADGLAVAIEIGGLGVAGGGGS